MAPTRTKKRKSTESTSSIDAQNFPAPPQMIPTKTRSPTRTPPSNRSPIKKTKMNITLGQKQALIDNLQLEITERARKLRAQYMLQAQGLRTRIEIRVNRIPTALRKAKMGDLLLKYGETVKPALAEPSRSVSPRKHVIPAERSNVRRSPSPQRPAKRTSDAMVVDKENEDIENPKKRARGAPAAPARTVSRAKVQPNQVLSPRSANSQTLPRSPIRPSPGKSMLARPVSPLKPAAPVPVGGAAGILTNMVSKPTRSAAATTRKAVAETTSTTVAAKGKRAAPSTAASRAGRGRGSTISDKSDSSTSTTIVRKPVPVKKDPPAARGKGVLGTIKGMTSQKKMPAAVKAGPAATTGGRVLRKRN